VGYLVFQKKEMKSNPEIVEAERISMVARPRCIVCGNCGKYVYECLQDRLFGTPGRWSIRKCEDIDCGTHWLDPRPIDEEIAQIYTNYYTHDDNEGSTLRSRLKNVYGDAITAFASRKYDGVTNDIGFLPRLLSYMLYLSPGRIADAKARAMLLPVRVGRRLLEVGFGSGETLRRLSALGWVAEGVEVDPMVVDRARARGLNVKLGNLRELQYSDGTFDAIVSNHVIEHFSDPSGFLTECYRLLKRGGVVVAYTPNVESFGHRLFRGDWRGLEPPRHLYLFTSRSLRRLAKQAGFSVAQCEGSGRGSQSFY